MFCLAGATRTNVNQCNGNLRPEDLDDCNMHSCDDGNDIEWLRESHRQLSILLNNFVQLADTILSISYNTDNLIVVCSATRYGCCPDGITEAEGDNYFGCPVGDTISRGACVETEFGCCLDGQTSAKGPFMKGCADVDCVVCKGAGEQVGARN